MKITRPTALLQTDAAGWARLSLVHYLSDPGFLIYLSTLLSPPPFLTTR